MLCNSDQTRCIFRVQADLRLFKVVSFQTKYYLTVHSGIVIDTSGPEEGIICLGLRTALKWLSLSHSLPFYDIVFIILGPIVDQHPFLPCRVCVIPSDKIHNHVTVLGPNPRITYQLWNVFPIRWWCWNITTDERGANYAKVKPWRLSFCCYSPPPVFDFTAKVKMGCTHLGVSNILYLKLI